ncbi:TPA: hypothetical protein DEX28_00675 [Patescibacteria group bacterium]|nr:hypothetical protein [Patescibacteria group bacterium]
MEFLLGNPWVALLVLAWTLTWKGMALWKAARSSQKNWFVALLVINTLGVLEIFYLYFWDRLKELFKRNRQV